MFSHYVALVYLWGADMIISCKNLHVFYFSSIFSSVANAGFRLIGEPQNQPDPQNPHELEALYTNDDGRDGWVFGWQNKQKAQINGIVVIATKCAIIYFNMSFVSGMYTCSYSATIGCFF